MIKKATESDEKESKMKDLSREEKLEQRVEALEREIWRMADKCGDNKWKRVKRTFFVLSLVMLYVFYENDYISSLFENDVNILNILHSLITIIFGVGFAAGLVMFVAYGILFYIIDGSLKEEKAIAKKIGELETIKFSKYDKE